MIWFVPVAIFERNVPKNEKLTNLFLGEKGGDVSETAKLAHHKKEKREEHKGFLSPLMVWS
ncbi:hypothetical protein K3L72_19415 [Bacillus altitudinis]|uniref:hypothetical protein n=1 Tax=Bacillus altitudinis TaxID=293387 RepID=UPI00223627AE|nr:hypothetical protein [Bacillus altitudinis]MCW4359941.1 hypothetical protein [Bacillus altitudinis]